MKEPGLYVLDKDTHYAIVNGSLYEVEPVFDLPHGYYDNDLNPISEVQVIAELKAKDEGVKKYDPNQPRVPAGFPEGGRWSGQVGTPYKHAPQPAPDGTYRFWHGTTSDVIDSIMDQGLKAKSGRHNWGPTYYTGDREGSVFITDDINLARSFAWTANDEAKDGVKDIAPVILELKIPREKLYGVDAPFKRDDIAFSGSWYGAEDIPPSEIVKVWTQDYNSGDWFEMARKADTFYAVLFASTVARKYDVNQPREPKGSPEGGRWSDGDGVPKGVHVKRAQVKGRGKNKEFVQKAVDDLPEEHAKLLWSGEPGREVRVYSMPTVLNNNREVAGLARNMLRINSGIELNIADTVKGRKIKTVGGTVFHEFGHALDYLSGYALSDKFGPMVQQWGEKMSVSERYLAAHYMQNKVEAFAELYRLAYAPERVKSAFGMGRQAASIMFAGPLKALKEHRL